MFVVVVQGLRHVFWTRGKKAAGVENTCIPGPTEHWGDERAPWQQVKAGRCAGGWGMVTPLKVQ